MKKTRIEWLDFLRGCAALFVVFQHVFEDAFPEVEEFGYNYLNFGITGVVLFFFVSGFVIPYSCRNFTLKSYFISRFFRIFPLLWIILTINYFLILLDVVSPKDGYDVSSLLSLLLNYLLVNEYFKYQFLLGVTWTLSIEIFWYILFAFYFVFLRNKITPQKLILLSNACLLLFGCIMFFYDIRLPVGRMGLIEVALIGYLAFNCFDKKCSLINFSIYAILSFIVLLLLFFQGFYLEKNPVISFYSVFNSWMLAMTIFYFSFFIVSKRILSLNFRLGVFFGTISYSTYLIHPIIRDVFYKNFGDGVIYIMLIFIIVYMASWVSYKYVESSFIRIGKKLKG